MSRDLSFLHEPIADREAGEAFVRRLHSEGMLFHFEDDVHDIIWDGVKAPTHDKLEALDARRCELYDLEWGDYKCPIGFALHVMDL